MSSRALRIVLVHLDATAATPGRLALARQLAQQHGAQLHALYACTPSFLELPFAPEMGPTLAAGLQEIDEARRDKVLQAFDKQMTQPGPLALWAQTDDVPIASAFAQQALYGDLLVLGQYDPQDEAARCIPPDFVEDVLLASGRPALVLPFGGWKQAVGANVAIAWKETPEAARAVKAAMPFLQRAQRVHVLAWQESGPPRLGGVALDLDQYLRAHGVQATWHREDSTPERLGDVLLSRVFDLDADLLVMGCYGHSRAREWILGGVSRTLLASMTLPVLMSH